VVGRPRASPPRRSPTSGVRCVRACPSGASARHIHERWRNSGASCLPPRARRRRSGGARLFSTTGGASAGVTSAMAEEQGTTPDLQLAWGRWGWRSGRTRSRGLPSRRVQCRTISAARGEIRKFARSKMSQLSQQLEVVRGFVAIGPVMMSTVREPRQGEAQLMQLHLRPEKNLSETQSRRDGRAPTPRLRRVRY